jgi:hypothetical protein
MITHPPSPFHHLQNFVEDAFAFFDDIVSIGDSLLGDDGSGIFRFKNLADTFKRIRGEFNLVKSYKATLSLAPVPGICMMLAARPATSAIVED